MLIIIIIITVQQLYFWFPILFSSATSRDFCRILFWVEEGLVFVFCEGANSTSQHQRILRFFFQVEEGLLIDFV